MKEEELRSALQACGARIADLERAVAEGTQREEGLRDSVRSARWVQYLVRIFNCCSVTGLGWYVRRRDSVVVRSWLRRGGDGMVKYRRRRAAVFRQAPTLVLVPLVGCCPALANGKQRKNQTVVSSSVQVFLFVFFVYFRFRFFSSCVCFLFSACKRRTVTYTFT